MNRASLLHPHRWTLLAKLLVSIITLYLLVTTVVGAVTVWRSHQSLMHQVDQQLVSMSRGSSAPDDDGQHRLPPGIGRGTLSCALGSDGQFLGLCIASSPTGLPQDLTSADAARLFGQQSATSRPTTVELSGDRQYRVLAETSRGGVRTYVGLPVDPINRTTADLVRNFALVSLAGLVVVVVGATLLVRRALAPLRRVSATASRVSTLPLSTGAVGTVERVPEHDTDPRTEVGQVGSSLNGLLDHVDAALAARHQSETQVRQFVADASHELRTPLASIRGYAELSRRETQSVPPGVQHAIGRIGSEAERMTALVEDMLLLARLDAGRPLDSAPVDLTMLAVESVSDAQVAGREHHWTLDLPEEPCEVIGDESRLRQVLINLLGNARKHTPAGTTVTTRVRSTPSGAEVVVHDDGPGIPPELQPHVFERFARGDAARHRAEGSTGLGLAIVQAVAAAHGGTVEVDSRPGSTSVRLLLPGRPGQPGPHDELS